MRGAISFAIASFAVASASLVNLADVKPETSGTITVAHGKYIVEFDSAAHYSALGRRAASPHEAIYSQLQSRSIKYDVGIEYDDDVFVGASMTLSSDDLTSLASVEGIVNISPVHDIYIPDIVNYAPESKWPANRVAKRDFVERQANGTVANSTSSATASASSSVLTPVTSTSTPASSFVANATSTSVAANSTTSAPVAANTTVVPPVFPQFTDTGFSNLGSVQLDKLHAAGFKGKGIQIAVIDGGVDYTRPALGGGFGKGFPIVGGYDFVGDNYNGSSTIPQPKADPLDQCYAHGSAVTGVIVARANEYNVTGAAPEADVYVYRVFSCLGKTSTDIVLQAMMRAYKEGADVINLSLGESAGWADTTLSVAASRLVDRGVTVVTSAANRGQVGSFFASSPATAAGVISVGASNAGFYAAQQAVVSTGYGPITYFNWQSFTDTPEHPLTPKQYYPTFAFTTDPAVAADGCTRTNQNLTGKIVIARRGGCALADKAEAAQADGAAGILIVNGQGQQPLYQNFPLIGFGIISYEDGNYLLGQIAAGNVPQLAFDFAPTTIPNTWDGNTTTMFSQIGPSNDLFVSTHVVAPGASIIGIVPDNAALGLYNWTLIDGTSFSSPLVAGAAAVYLQAKGKVGPRKVKAAFEHSAKPFPVSRQDSTLLSVASQGAGLLQLADSVNADVAIREVDWKQTASEIHLNDTANFDATHVFAITNNGRKRVKYTLKHIAAGTALTYGTGPYKNQSNPWPVPQVSNAASVSSWSSEYTIWPGHTTTAWLTFSPPTGVDQSQFPVYSGWIQISGDGKSYRVPYLGLAARSKSIPIIDGSNFAFGFGTPIIMNSRGGVQSGTTTYTFVGRDYPTVLYRLVAGTRSLVIDVVKSDAKLGFTANYNTRREVLAAASPEEVERELQILRREADNAPSHDSHHELSKRFGLLSFWCSLTNNKGLGCSGFGKRQGTFAKVPTVGRVYDGTLLPRNTGDEDQLGGVYNSLAVRNKVFLNGTAIPTGSYRFLLRALKHTGDPTKQEDYEAWLSQPFVVA